MFMLLPVQLPQVMEESLNQLMAEQHGLKFCTTGTEHQMISHAHKHGMIWPQQLIRIMRAMYSSAALTFSKQQMAEHHGRNSQAGGVAAADRTSMLISTPLFSNPVTPIKFTLEMMVVYSAHLMQELPSLIRHS